MSAVVWEDPPPSLSGAGNTAAIRAFAEELRANPGKWARYPSLPKGSGSPTRDRIVKGHWVGGSGFEAVGRKVDGQTVIYVRFVGDAA